MIALVYACASASPWLVPATAHAQSEGAINIPVGGSIALGAGITFPETVSESMSSTSRAAHGLLDLNRISGKIRLSNGVQIEPFVVLRSESTEEINQDINGATTTREEMKKGDSTLGLGGACYYPIAIGFNTELQLVGQAVLERRGTTQDPDGPDNETTTTKSTMQVGYGLAVEYWFAEHISFMASATNTLISVSSESTDRQLGSGSENRTESSSQEIGLVWDPIVTGTFNIWF